MHRKRHCQGRACAAALHHACPAVVVVDCTPAASVRSLRYITIEIHRRMVQRTMCLRGTRPRALLAECRQRRSQRRSQWLDPACSTPDWSFLHADVDDVVLATTGCCVGRYLLAQNAFFQRYPVQSNACVCSVSFSNFLHVDHVAVVHDRNCQLGVTVSECNRMHLRCPWQGQVPYYVEISCFSSQKSQIR